MSRTVKEVEIEEVRVTDSAVSPGSTITARTVVRVHNYFWRDQGEDACGSDATSCSTSFLQTQGYCVRVIVTLGGTEFRANPKCLRYPLPGDSHTFDIDIDIPAPQEVGTYSVNSLIELTGSNKRSDRVSDTLVVSEEPSQEPPSDPTNGGGGDNGGSSGDLLQTIIENPGKATVVGIGGLVLINKATGD